MIDNFSFFDSPGNLALKKVDETEAGSNERKIWALNDSIRDLAKKDRSFALINSNSNAKEIDQIFNYLSRLSDEIDKRLNVAPDSKIAAEMIVEELMDKYLNIEDTNEEQIDLDLTKPLYGQFFQKNINKLLIAWVYRDLISGMILPIYHYVDAHIDDVMMSFESDTSNGSKLIYEHKSIYYFLHNIAIATALAVCVPNLITRTAADEKSTPGDNLTKDFLFTDDSDAAMFFYHSGIYDYLLGNSSGKASLTKTYTLLAALTKTPKLVTRPDSMKNRLIEVIKNEPADNPKMFSSERLERVLKLLENFNLNTTSLRKTQSKLKE